MWISKREIIRLERELSHALKRAEAAENRLEEERQRHDWLSLQLTSRVITKHGGYGLDHEKPPEPEPHPRGFTHEPTEFDLARLEFYKRCAVEAGKDEQDGQAKWEAEMRGEELQIEYETEQ